MVSSWTKSALENWVIWFTIKLVIFSIAWLFFINPNITFLAKEFQQAVLVIYVVVFLAVAFRFDLVLEGLGAVFRVKKR